MVYSSIRVSSRTVYVAACAQRAAWLFFAFVLTIMGGSVSATQPAACYLEQTEDSIILGNGLCRIVWNRTVQGWSAEYQCIVRSRWETIAWDHIEENVGYGVVFGEPKDDQVGSLSGGVVQSTLPGPSVRPELILSSDETVELRWSFELVDAANGHWPIVSTYVICSGQMHVLEEVRFTSPIHTRVRYQRGWQARGVSREFFEGVIHSVTHAGWKLGPASFLILTTQGAGVWSATSGGGGLVRYQKESEREPVDRQTPGDQVSYSVFHRVPHTMGGEGWVETRPSGHHTIRHYLIMCPGSLFQRGTIEYMHRLQPLEKLPLRYSWRVFLDRQVEGMTNAPGVFDDHSDWGHNELGWCQSDDGREPQLPRNRQALDGDGNWDLWQAIALQEYGKRFGDDWALARSRKLVKGIKQELWQINDPSTVCDGAFWMFRPRTPEEYEERRAMAPTSEASGPIDNSSNLWVCDSGKIGTLLCDLYELTRDEEVLKKARRAGDFLLRLQSGDGNLRAGRVHISGTTVYPANLATNSCAIMLWSRLYELTREKEYYDAAIFCADRTMFLWLDGRAWRMYGGEADRPQDISSSAAACATWGFALCYRATRYVPALDAVRCSANWHLAQQSLFDTHLGCYAPQAFWRGRDFRATGGFPQGVLAEGHNQLLGNRPEECLAQYLAWTVTGDRAYLESALAYLVWQTYMQHNCPSDCRFHGGASEGFDWQVDTPNHLETVSLGRTMGCDLTLFALFDQGVIAPE